MKATHRPDLFTWAQFDESRNLDFNGLAWIHPAGTVLIDPMPLSDHDRRHLISLGSTAWIVITNSDHTRAAQDLAAQLGAKLAGPAAEKDNFPFVCDRWLEDGDELVPGLRALTLAGSKTPSELALWLDPDTLIFGDLVRGHVGGRLNHLPDAKLVDKALALASLRRLSLLPASAVLVGDGWSCFRDGQARLRELVG